MNLHLLNSVHVFILSCTSFDAWKNRRDIVSSVVAGMALASSTVISQLDSIVFNAVNRVKSGGCIDRKWMIILDNVSGSVGNSKSATSCEFNAQSTISARNSSRGKKRYGLYLASMQIIHSLGSLQ